MEKHHTKKAGNHIARFKLRLFVTANAPNSRIAQDNLKAICSQYKTHAFEIETVDVADNPKMAIQNKIFLTPALQIVDPGPAMTIYGNLSDQNKLLNLFS